MKYKEETIVKAYIDYLDNPFADGYTVAAMERKYGMSIEEMKKLYAKHKAKKMQPEELLKELGKIIGKGNAYLDNDSIIRKSRELLLDNGWIK